MSDDKIKAKNESDIEIGKRLRSVRKANNKTQENFCELYPDSVKRIESGENSLTLKNALEISQKYNVSLDWLLGLNINGKGINFVLDGKIKILSESTPTNSPLSSEHNIAMEIDGYLFDFIIALSNAEKVKHTPELYNERIQEAERNYNDALKRDEKHEPLVYRLLSPNAKTMEMLDDNGNVVKQYFGE